MAIDKVMRGRIDTLVEIYLNDLESTSRDAGWHQPSVLQRMIDFKGDLPKASGNDQADMKMIHEIKFLRREHALLGQARYLFGQPCGSGEVPEDLAVALLAARFYREQSADRIAHTLGLTMDQYKGRLSRGREVMALELLRIDRFMEAHCYAATA